MATSALTQAASLQCPHQGKITVQGNALLTIDGGAIVRSTEAAAAVIACPNTNAPCTSVTPSPSKLLQVGGQPAILAASMTTNQGTVTIGGASPLLILDE